MNERKPKSLTKELVCKLTPEEKADIADQLTERIGRKDWLEDAKKVAAKKYAAQIEEVVAEINDLSNKIRAGEELRPVKCELRYDDPVPGHKTTYRLDTGAKICSEIMSDDELQGELFPGEDEAAEAPEAEAAPEPDPAAQLPLLSSADVHPDEKVKPEDVIASAAVDYAAAVDTAAEPEAKNPDELKNLVDFCECGEPATNHLTGNRGICTACLVKDGEERQQAIMKKIKETVTDGGKVVFRHRFGFGCAPRYQDTTCFRFRFGQSWSNPIYLPGKCGENENSVAENYRQFLRGLTGVIEEA